MNRTWPAVVAAAALVAGCGGVAAAEGDHDALSYATRYYRDTMTRLLWPKSAPLVRLTMRASCRQARSHYRIVDADAYARTLARRARALDRLHRVPSDADELARACISGLQRAARQDAAGERG